MTTKGSCTWFTKMWCISSHSHRPRSKVQKQYSLLLRTPELLVSLCVQFSNTLHLILLQAIPECQRTPLERDFTHLQMPCCTHSGELPEFQDQKWRRQKNLSVHDEFCIWVLLIVVNLILECLWFWVAVLQHPIAFWAQFARWSFHLTMFPSAQCFDPVAMAWRI